MALLPGAFNSKEHDDMGSFEPIPAGEYTAQIVESAIKPTKKALDEKNGNEELAMEAYSGLRLNLQFKVMGGEYDGSTVWVGLNIKNPNPQAVEISQKELATICRAVGKVSVQDSAELHGIPMLIKVAIKPASSQYDAQNVIKGYKAHTGAIPTSAVAPEPKSSDTGQRKGKKLFDD